MRLVALIAFLLTAAPAAMAEPVVKIVNFTADWCPNCQILNPRIDEAMAQFPEGTVERVDLDLTLARGDNRDAAFNQAFNTAITHQAGYLWDWYAGVTGIAVVISADNGEPISCMNRALTVDEIAFRIKEASILTTRATPGSRKPQGPDCPPPMR